MKEKSGTFRDTLQKYQKGEVKLEKYQKIGIFFLVVVISGFVGWLWEFILHEISGGFQNIYIEGGNLLPWVNIYAVGALLIFLTGFKFKRRPWAVFLVSALVCGLLELFAGWFAYVCFDGARYWDYQNSWWGIGNINGFVCPASMIAFGLGALALIYLLLPWCIHLSQKMTKKAFLTLTTLLFVMIMTDEIVNLILKILDHPTAMNLYESWGWKYK